MKISVPVSSSFRIRTSARTLLRICVVASVGIAQGLSAASSTWLNTGSDWNTVGNWSAGFPTAGNGVGPIFSSAAVTSPNISTSVTVGTMQFNTATSSGYTISSSSGSTTLTLNSLGTSGVAANWAINGANTSGTNTVTAPIILSGAALSFVQAAGGTLSISGPISGTSALILGSSGRINLTGSNNSYSGGSTIARSGSVGVMSLGNAGANGSLGTGAITIGGTAVLGGTAAGTLNYMGGVENSNKTINFNYDSTIDTTGATGGLTLSGSITVGAAGRTITLTGNTSGNEITGSIPDNTATKLTKTGTGTWILSGSNAYTGVTTVSGGVLQLNNANAISGGIATTGGTSGITVNGGVIGLGQGNFTRGLGTGVTQVQFTGSGGGFSAHGADRSVNLGGSGANVTWGTGSFIPAASNLILGASSADATVEFQNGIVLGTTGTNTRTIQVDNGTAAVDARVSGVISNSGGTQSLTKTGTGTLVLTGANTYNGATTVSAGTLLVNTSHTGGGAYAINAGRLGGGGTITTAGNAGIALASGAQLAPGATTGAAGTLTAALGTGSLNISAGVGGANTGALVFELGSSSDQFTLTGGTLVIGSGELEFSDFSFTALSGLSGPYTLFATNSAISGTLGSVLTGSIGGYTGTLSFADGGTDLILTVVPEPNVAMLVVGGMGMLMLVNRRRGRGI